MNDRVTYWLYWGRDIVATVRAAPGLPADDVRCRALASYQRVPLYYPGANPAEISARILRSRVFTFPPDGGPSNEVTR
jgi:hypothetical protein